MDEDAWSVDGWLARLPAVLDFLRDAELRDVLDLDFSPESLDGVEDYVADRLGDSEDEDEDDRWLAEGAAAYLGEALLRLAGGGWRPAPEPGQAPVVEADPALRLAPISPFHVVLAAARDGTSGRFRGIFEGWAGAVAARRAADPAWAPVKEPTPGVDPVIVEVPEVEHLARWLAAREAGFPQWTGDYGADTVWDFSAGSLEDLGGLVLGRIHTPAELGAAEHRAFVDGAEWYLGETLRRVKGGRWAYRHGNPDLNMFLGHPYVEQVEPGAETVVPYVSLELIVQRRDIDHLRRRFEAFAD